MLFADPLAPYIAAVEAARQRMDQATSLAAANLARGDYYEAKKALAGARQSLGTTCLAA
jgi:hypothetical protein